MDTVWRNKIDIRRVSDSENVVADVLSKIEELQFSIDYSALAESRQDDEEVEKYLRDFEFQLKKVKILEPGTAIYTVKETPQLFLTKLFR